MSGRKICLKAELQILLKIITEPIKNKIPKADSHKYTSNTRKEGEKNRGSVIIEKKNRRIPMFSFLAPQILHVASGYGVVHVLSLRVDGLLRLILLCIFDLDRRAKLVNNYELIASFNALEQTKTVDDDERCRKNKGKCKTHLHVHDFLENLQISCGNELQEALDEGFSSLAADGTHHKASGRGWRRGFTYGWRIEGVRTGPSSGRGRRRGCRRRRAASGRTDGQHDRLDDSLRMGHALLYQSRESARRLLRYLSKYKAAGGHI